MNLPRFVGVPSDPLNLILGPFEDRSLRADTYASNRSRGSSKFRAAESSMHRSSAFEEGEEIIETDRRLQCRSATNRSPMPGMARATVALRTVEEEFSSLITIRYPLDNSRDAAT